MAYKRIGLLLSAMSFIGIGGALSVVTPMETLVEHASSRRSKGRERNTGVLRFRVRSRKTMTVPQMKRIAKKRRNMAKRGQR